MARKTTTPDFPSDQQVFKALFDRIAEKGLGKARLSDLATQFNVPLVDFYAAYPSVQSIIDQFLNYIDQQMIKSAVLDSESDKRDVYFDLLMNRFDTLQEHRDGVKRWLSDMSKQPLLWAGLLKRWDKSLSLMLDIAKDSPVFPIKKIGLAGIYLNGLREWTKDDSEDLSKTMVSIDKSLTKAQDFTQKYLTKKVA